MIKKKLKLYYKILVQLFFKLLYGNVLLSRNINNLIKKEKIENKKFKSFNNKHYNLYKVDNARIYTDNNENVAVIKDNFILSDVSFQQFKGRLKDISYNSVLKKGTPSFVKKINGKVFNLCQGGSGNNYFHFIFDILPKIYLLNSKIDIKKIDYFYLLGVSKWQIDILKILGIKEKKIINSKINKHISADEIYFVDHPWYFKGIFQTNIDKLPDWIIKTNRKILFNKKTVKKKENANRIFIDRSDSKYNHCQISNLREIIKFAKDKKFKIYQLSNFSFKKQISLFQNSKIIMGAHGAGFTNIIFCKPSTKIIELIPSNHPNMQTKRICKVLSLNYYRIKTIPDDSDKNFPFKIDINKKKIKFLKKIIDL